LDCEFMATGHYAQKRFEQERYIISKGKDSNKDQSYVLWGLDQHKLSRTLFPIGGFHKPEIRQMAAERGYDELAKKAESYEICFIPDNDYRSFLARRQPDAIEKLKGGDFVSTEGIVLGKHEGFPFYTIGQRKGLGIALGKPMFVTRIDAETNTVVLGEVEDLNQQSMWVGNINFVKYPDLYDGTVTITKIRSRHQGAPAFAQQIDNRIRVDFATTVDSITPGQSAVMYEGDDVLAGGHILSVIEPA
ncbi:MAG TPA: tRNA 2-thiouridine(34) synthase MnmA, partial [Chitinophagales bacterium]|nr:tRNA 2-thiouridine(34) synthase MnmA [Chitinophagales bacterium]